MIGEFETFSGRLRPRLCLCEPTVCERFLKYELSIALVSFQSFDSRSLDTFCHFGYGHASFPENAIFLRPGSSVAL